jgi:hypothetical protein
VTDRSARASWSPGSAPVLRRVRPRAGEQLAYADLEMDVAAHRVRRSGDQVALGPTEFVCSSISSSIRGGCSP